MFDQTPAGLEQDRVGSGAKLGLRTKRILETIGAYKIEWRPQRVSRKGAA